MAYTYLNLINFQKHISFVVVAKKECLRGKTVGTGIFTAYFL